MMADDVGSSELITKDGGAPSVCESSVIKRKRSSDVWNHFKKDKNGEKAYCDYCQKGLSAKSQHGTKSMLNHLKSCVYKKLKEREQGQLLLPSMQSCDLVTNLNTNELVSYRFDQNCSREDVAKFLIMSELPFRTVEHPAFQTLLKNLRPEFHLFKRDIVKFDCMALYEKEMKKLKESLIGVQGHISFTTVMWTSNQTMDYMSLTAHYVDEEWKIKKRIINFKVIEEQHNALVLSLAITTCLSDWNIEDKIFGVIVDDLSTNNSIVNILRDHYKVSLPLGGEFFHIRCCAHVINRIVNEGLKESNNELFRIREAIKHVKGSPLRLQKFNDILKHLKFEGKRCLCLDVPTRWNSTYLMLERALEFKEAFNRLEIIDPTFKSSPNEDDWDKALSLCNFLKIFYESTKIFSSTKIPTANLYFHEVCMIHMHLKRERKDLLISSMVKRMRHEFNQYWSDAYLFLAIAVILDPRHKMCLVEFWFQKIYGSSVDAYPYIQRIYEGLQRLFDYYKNSTPKESGDIIHGSHGDTKASSSQLDALDEIDMDFEQQYDLYTQDKMRANPLKSELEMYLEEQRHPRDDAFDILKFWKVHQKKWLTLSRMARDILAIPVSTVSSESTFNTGSRVLDQFYSSLSAKTVEALICTKDWLQDSYSVSEELHEVTSIVDEDIDD